MARSSAAKTVAFYSWTGVLERFQKETAAVLGWEKVVKLAKIRIE
jgi:hypothetical protein